MTRVIKQALALSISNFLSTNHTSGLLSRLDDCRNTKLSPPTDEMVRRPLVIPVLCMNARCWIARSLSGRAGVKAARYYRVRPGQPVSRTIPSPRRPRKSDINADRDPRMTTMTVVVPPCRYYAPAHLFHGTHLEGGTHAATKTGIEIMV